MTSEMGLINVTRLVEDLGGAKNQYTYTKIKNLLSGIEGKSTPTEIQIVKRVIQDNLTLIVTKLTLAEQRAIKKLKKKQNKS
jgi:hypothetical protein